MAESIGALPERPERTDRKENSWQVSKLGLVTSVGAAALVGVYGAFCIASVAGDAVNPNTLVGGKDLGGLTRDEAITALSPTLDRLRSERGVHALMENGTEAAFLSYNQLGVNFDAFSLAQEAYDSSHSSNVFADGWRLLTATLGQGTSVTPVPESNWEAAAAERLAEAVRQPSQPFSYQLIGDNSLALTRESFGRDVDLKELTRRLGEAEADEQGDLTVTLPLTEVPGEPGDLAAVHEALCGAAANARYDAATQSILPERFAMDFDLEQAQALLNAAAPGETVFVPVTASQPQITAAELEQVLFRDVLGTYTTRVGGSTGRKANVKLTAQRVNGTVLNSGEEFNYYSLCGPFSGANGYKPAPGYQNGKTVDMDGGGACQCSSTTYAAALLANMEIVARTAHGFASDYIGLGLDATVSGGGPEFIFRNNTPYPVKVEAIYSDNNRLTVNIYGTKTDDTTVKMRVEELSSTPYAEQVIVSPDLAPGQRVVEQTPYTGHVVNTYRQIYDGNGVLLSETFEARSNYKKRDRIVKVGPAAPVEPSPEVVTEPAADPNPEVPAVSPVEIPIEVPQETTPAPVVEPAPQPTELPGGGMPTPIEEQVEQLAPAPEESVP